MKNLGIAFLLCSTAAMGIYRVGDRPTNKCWDAIDVPGGKICLDDAPKRGFVSVLLFNAGWCGPCNNEFRELVPLAEIFAGEKVAFISLSIDGFRHGSGSGEAFLRAWEKKFGIDRAKAYWVVASSPHDAGRDYFTSTPIPNAVVLDADGRVAFKAISPGARRIATEVEKLLTK